LIRYYQAAHNLKLLKNLINYQLRFSLLHTLAAKYKKQLSNTIKMFTISPSLYIIKGLKIKLLCNYPNMKSINQIRQDFVTNYQSTNDINAIFTHISSLYTQKPKVVT